jgi:hypothetical protein
MRSSPFASGSINVHYARGVLGLLALVTAVAGAAAGTPAALVLVILSVAAWRGCPTCWAVGLMQTREREACLDRRCRTRASTRTQERQSLRGDPEEAVVGRPMRLRTRILEGEAGVAHMHDRVQR